MRVYLSGPMSGYPSFNVPAFTEAAEYLRGLGFFVISPHEADEKDGIGGYTKRSPDGDVSALTAQTGETWGSLLSRDIKIIADGQIDVVAVLPGWEKSKGARLEVFTAILLGKPVGYVYGKSVRTMSQGQFLETIFNSMKEGK